ncbi:hypothetical protein F5B22DRAFT_611061 [Xylaria bambusicola]|uniref:uncharacterized protein n=1 Tax=Xylaria bambusicola TaxID=326684 RepID=UPI002008E2A1|nr:uncharacterized protein F5B22DRAFT_611061 [Xylaria bambusicola]KAI0514586.1 hypothetical protein F5B22DRAFT_611061 [Xylaria bambusicola]
MLIRRLGARVPRVLGPATASRSTFVTLRETPSLHSGAALRYGLPKIEKRQQLSRVYSNFAPRDYSRYDAYAQPPKSRGSRLKDMAIGSILTIIAYLAYKSYSLWDVVKHAREEIDVAIELDEIYSHYDQLLDQAEAAGDMEKSQSLFKERAMALVRAMLRNQEDQTINDLGPLPTLPEDYDGGQSHGAQIFGGGDTLMLMPQCPPLDEGNSLSPRHLVAVAINAFAEDIGINDDAMGLVNYRTPKVHEIIRRSRFMLEKLRKEGTIDGMTLVTVYLWDFEFMFVYDEGIIMYQ